MSIFIKGNIRKIFELYPGLNRRLRLYFNIRIRFTFFEDIEKLVPEKGKILDVGCGFGIFTNIMATRSEARDVLGIDVAGDKISVANRSIKTRKNIRFILADAADFLRAQDRYDVITCYDFLHHISYEKQITLLENCFKSLNENGLLIIKDNDVKPLWKLCLNYAYDLVMMNMGLTRSERPSFRDPRELKDILKNIGFTNVKSRSLRTRSPHPHVVLLAKKSHL